MDMTETIASGIFTRIDHYESLLSIKHPQVTMVFHDGDETTPDWDEDAPSWFTRA